MHTIKWFDRKFDFRQLTLSYPDILERLIQSPSLFKNVTKGVENSLLNEKWMGKWSVKEHIGHLWILEPLWQKRFKEIQQQAPAMSPVDLQNKATDEAHFHLIDIHNILQDFDTERNSTIDLLQSFSDEDFQNRLYHPRLQQPMRILDLMYFVAEHDIHHYNAIKQILNTLQ